MGAQLKLSLEIGTGKVASVAEFGQRQEAAVQSVHRAIAPAVSGQAVSGASRSADIMQLRRAGLPSQNAAAETRRRVEVEGTLNQQHHLVENYTFETFVEGKSNQLAKAASQQIAENPA